jgi:hypothetical protein
MITYTTMNLLPEEDKKRVRMMYYLRLAFVAMIVVLIVTLIGIIFLIPPFFLVVLKEENLAAQMIAIQQSPAFREGAKIGQTIKDANQSVSQLSGGDGLALSTVFSELLSIKKPGIALTGFFITKETAPTSAKTKITLRGEALTREALISFREALEGHALFSAVELPVSSLIKSRDIPFSLGVSFNLGEFRKAEIKQENTETMPVLEQTIQ